jgi:hypothetical protein
MLYRIPTPSRTRRTHSHLQHSTSTSTSTPPTHRPRTLVPRPGTQSRTHARGDQSLRHRTRKHEHEQSVPTASQPRDGAEYEQPLPTHVDEAPPARRAGRIVLHRSGAVASAMRWRRACVRSFGAFYTAVGTTAYPIRRIRACVRARGGYTWLPTYHALSTYAVLGTG